MSLDDKLKEILTGSWKLQDDQIAQIKQAFADEGWLPEKKSFFKKGWDAGYHTAEIEYEAVGYVGKEVRLDILTGQEWYERFEKELWVPPKQGTRINQNDDGESHDRFFRSGGENFMYERAIEAAKKAAGIDG